MSQLLSEKSWLSQKMSKRCGNFIDKSPSILPAGKWSGDTEDSVATCLKQYYVDHAVTALKLIKGKDEKSDEPKFRVEPFANKLRKGIYTEIRPCLRPEEKTRYQTVINELKETTYESQWNKVEGKTRDPVPGLPEGMVPLETTFGQRTSKGQTMKELINPEKSHYQVLNESLVGHDMYKKTHNNYFPNEKLCRNYLTPAFDKNATFGERTKYDPREIWVRCACHWHETEPVVVSNETQSNFVDRFSHKLGQCRSPNKIQQNFPKDYVCGKPSNRELYGVEELLKDSNCPPCLSKRDLKEWLSSFNVLRSCLRKKFDHQFKYSDWYKKFLFYDRARCNFLPLETFYEICDCLKIYFDKEKLVPLLTLLSIVRKNEINYEKFLNILNHNGNPVELMKINDIPQRNQYYITSTQSANCDYLIINNCEAAAPAGIPSIRHDLSRPFAPPGGCLADLENLGDETSSGNLINPSVFMNYGLSFRDFFAPRTKEVIRGLFGKIGYELGDEAFEKLWKIGLDRDKTGAVCVDTFNQLVLSHYPRKPLVIDEATC